MSECKVVSMEKRREQSEQEKREESREYHTKGFTECLTTIYSSLKKTGADYMTLPFLFLHLSMMLCDGYFVDPQKIKTNQKRGRTHDEN